MPSRWEYSEPGQDGNVAALRLISCAMVLINMMKTHEKYMKEAINEAFKAFKKDEVPVGAVIVLNGKIIARGHNTREKTKDPTGHAEINALKKATKKLNSWRLENAILYVTIEPCAMCAGAISQARIKKIVYGAKDKKGGAIESNIELYKKTGLNHYPEVESGVLAKECGEIISHYFRQKRDKAKSNITKKM